MVHTIRLPDDGGRAAPLHIPREIQTVVTRPATGQKSAARFYLAAVQRQFVSITSLGTAATLAAASRVPAAAKRSTLHHGRNTGQRIAGAGGAIRCHAQQTQGATTTFANTGADTSPP